MAKLIRLTNLIHQNIREFRLEKFEENLQKESWPTESKALVQRLPHPSRERVELRTML